MTLLSPLHPYAMGVSLLMGLLGVSQVQAADPAELFEKLSPSVWVVATADKNGIVLGSGSAVVIDAERMVTNCHVLKKAASVVVRHESTVHVARLEFADVERDLCTLTVKNLTAPPIKIAPLSSVKVGQKVIVIGAPLGYELTLADGLVSALRKDKEDAVELIQISAPISPGSSGGGVFSMSGDLVGISSSGRVDAQNLNFAIPSEWIQYVANRSELAEAKRKTEQAKSEVSRKSTRTLATERLVQGEELLAVVRRAMGLAANDASYADGSAIIDVTNPARRSISLGLTTWDANARFALHADRSELCITAAFAPAPERSWGGPIHYAKVPALWRNFVQCYRVYEFEPDQFALREKNGSANAFVIDIK